MHPSFLALFGYRLLVLVRSFLDFAAEARWSLELGMEDLALFGLVATPAVFLEFAEFVVSIFYGIFRLGRSVRFIELLEPIWEVSLGGRSHRDIWYDGGGGGGGHSNRGSLRSMPGRPGVHWRQESALHLFWSCAHSSLGLLYVGTLEIAPLSAREYQ